MDPFHRNIILDLLPAYIAGEASQESRSLVEDFARSDPEVAELIRAGSLELKEIMPAPTAPENLEMKTMKRIRSSIRRQMWYVATATTAILLLPLIAMQFTNEVNWDLADFIVMGCLLFGTGLSFVLISRALNNVAYRVAVGIAVGTGLLLIWMSLAVGIIGSGDSPANLLYIAVFVVGIVGAGIARLKPLGMSQTLFAVAIAQLLVPVVALVFWRSSFSESPGLTGVFLLNSIFAVLFIISAFVFKRAASDQTTIDI